MRMRHSAALLFTAIAVSSIGCTAKFCPTGNCGLDTMGVGKGGKSAVACSDCSGKGCPNCLHKLKQHVHAVKRSIYDKLTCGSGCGGDVVLDAWWDNPPTCDPCDNFGQWTGDRTCPPKPYRWGHVLGLRMPECVHEGCKGGKCEVPGGYADGVPIGSPEPHVDQGSEAPLRAEPPVMTTSGAQAAAIAPVSNSRPRGRRMLFQ